MTVKLGNQLRELRRQEGRTQEDLASFLGVSAQAVSRWEVGTCYPDIELIPVIADYFGVSIDWLFGFDGESQRKINELYDKLEKMNQENNGVDVSMDKCIALAREALAEFPENKKISFMLAEVLYNAGHVRYGEHYLNDAEGFKIYDVERHRSYDEWREAIIIYEKLLKNSLEPEMRHRATRHLVMLYALTDEKSKAMALAETVPDLNGCRELLRLFASDGREKVTTCQKTLLSFTKALADLMVRRDIVECASPEKIAKRIEEMLSVVEIVADGNYGEDNQLHALIATENLFLADRRWNAEDKEGAFHALDEALRHARYCPGLAEALPESYPWRCVSASVEEKIQDDPRWKEWTEKAFK